MNVVRRWSRKAERTKFALGSLDVRFPHAGQVTITGIIQLKLSASHHLFLQKAAFVPH